MAVNKRVYAVAVIPFIKRSNKIKMHSLWIQVALHSPSVIEGEWSACPHPQFDGVSPSLVAKPTQFKYIFFYNAEECLKGKPNLGPQENRVVQWLSRKTVITGTVVWCQAVSFTVFVLERWNSQLNKKACKEQLLDCYFFYPLRRVQLDFKVRSRTIIWYSDVVSHPSLQV